MRKEIVRREALKLRLNNKSYIEIQKILKDKYDYSVSTKQIKRWCIRFENGNWNLRDSSTRPHLIYYKFLQDDVFDVIKLRTQTGYSSYQLKVKMEEKGIFMSESTIKNIIKGSRLSRGNKMEGQRLKWVRFERKHPNSMWQIDGTQLDDGTWILPVIDDCTRYCLAIGLCKNMTTENVTGLLEQATSMHGKPREVLTDNGPEFGGRSKDSEFDKWCKKQGIKHIRSGIHKPTTVGKVSRIQFTIGYELPYCHEDYEYFRYRYNHERPHRSLHGKTPAELYFAFHKLF